MEKAGHILDYIIKLALFILVSIFFVPGFAFVHLFQKTWTGLLGDLFGLK